MEKGSYTFLLGAAAVAVAAAIVLMSVPAQSLGGTGIHSSTITQAKKDYMNVILVIKDAKLHHEELGDGSEPPTHEQIINSLNSEGFDCRFENVNELHCKTKISEGLIVDYWIPSPLATIIETGPPMAGMGTPEAVIPEGSIPEVADPGEGTEGPVVGNPIEGMSGG